MSEKLTNELRKKRKTGGSARQIERIVKEVEEFDKKYFHSDRKKEEQLKLWRFYFKNRKYLVRDNLIESIEKISIINQCSEKYVYTKLTTLYYEVFIKNKYVISVFGIANYTEILKHRVERVEKDLKVIYEIFMFSKENSGGLGYGLNYEYSVLIQTKTPSEVIKILSEHRQVHPIVLEAFFKKKMSWLNNV